MLRAYSILVYLFLYGPIVLIVLFSFNSGLSAADFQGFSVKWYAKVAGNDLMLAALKTSLIVAFTSAALATVMGTMAALALQRVKGPVRLIFDGAHLHRHHGAGHRHRHRDPDRAGHHLRSHECRAGQDLAGRCAAAAAYGLRLDHRRAHRCSRWRW